MLTENLVHIWQIDLDPTPSHSDLLRSVLTGDDLCRAGKISDPSVRSRFEVAHGAARLILGRYLVMPPTLLSWQTGPWGKPTIAGHEHTLRFSLSRSAGIALLAVTDPVT